MQHSTGPPAFNTPLACLVCLQARGSDLRVHFKNTREAAHALRGMDLVSVAAKEGPAAVIRSRGRCAGRGGVEPQALSQQLQPSELLHETHGRWVVQTHTPVRLGPRSMPPILTTAACPLALASRPRLRPTCRR